MFQQDESLRTKSATITLKPITHSPEGHQKQPSQNFRIRQSLKKIQDPVDFSQVKIGKEIQSGTYGKVFIGFLDGRFIAVKQVQDQKCNDELDIHTQLKHKNIVQCYGYIYGWYEIFDVAGSIADRLKIFGRFNEQLMKRFTIQILEGLEYLHSQKIVHRDLKGANILTNQRGHVKISDFGASRTMQINLSDTEFCNSMKGSFYWMAPELLRQHKHGRRIDIWSLGCVIIEMATASHPWPDCKMYADLVHLVESSKCPPIPQHLSPECQNFIKLCCQYDKMVRPQAYELKQHIWLK
ncbi:hypothetical protein pb186bvf_000661 [Paramecium bursaria]